MAATRIMDENSSGLDELEQTLMNGCPILASDAYTKMLNEAYLFMRDEVPVRSAR